MEHPGLVPRQPYGDSLDRHCLRAWNGDLVRLLDDRLSRGAARAFSERSACGEDGADHWRRLQMFVPFIVILPGLLAIAVLPVKLTGEGTAIATGGHSYNEVLPLMLARYCGPGLLGLGITALMAGVYVRDGGQRQRLFHRLDLRHLRRITQQESRRCAVRPHGPLEHARRRVHQHRHRLFRNAFPQHHGLCAGSI